MNIILLEPTELDENKIAVLTDERARHIRDVLHGKGGQPVRVGLLDGPRGTAIIESVSKSNVRLKCTFNEPALSAPSIDLLLALPRPKVLKRLWAQLAALGVGRIMLTNAVKVERNYFDTHVLDPSTFKPLLVEGLQQAGDTRLPEVTIHKRFKILVEDKLDEIIPNGLRLVAHPTAKRGLDEIAIPKLKKHVLLAIGPEGGWIEYELDLLQQHGFQPFRMGGRTLRVDTACIALLALVHARIAGR